MSEAFNVFNHPLFGDVGVNDGRNILSSYGAVNPYFGISSEDLASSLGGGGADGGYSSLYQIGAPRSLQFALSCVFRFPAGLSGTNAGHPQVRRALVFAPNLGSHEP